MCYCQRHATYYAGRCPGCDADTQALIAMGKAVSAVRDDCGDELDKELGPQGAGGSEERKA